MKVIRIVTHCIECGVAKAIGLMLAIALSKSLYAQSKTETSTPDFESNDSGDAVNIIGFERVVSSFEFWLSFGILLFAICLLTAQFFLFFRAKHIKFVPEDILRIVITTLVICGTLFFVAAGFSSEQIAPAIGLFGTVVGYLLGAAERKKVEKKDESDDA